MDGFTPWSALLGGGILGLGASLLLLANGRIAGVSDIVFGVFGGARDELRWRAGFTLGLLSVGCVAAIFAPNAVGLSPHPIAWLAVAGLLVGIGTRLSHGCTSGHGVCGISRLSPRSLVATLTFMLTAIATLLVMRRIGLT